MDYCTSDFCLAEYKKVIKKDLFYSKKNQLQFLRKFAIIPRYWLELIYI